MVFNSAAYKVAAARRLQAAVLVFALMINYAFWFQKNVNRGPLMLVLLQFFDSNGSLYTSF